MTPAIGILSTAISRRRRPKRRRCRARTHRHHPGNRRGVRPAVRRRPARGAWRACRCGHSRRHHPCPDTTLHFRRRRRTARSRRPRLPRTASEPRSSIDDPVIRQNMAFSAHRGSVSVSSSPSRSGDSSGVKQVRPTRPSGSPAQITPGGGSTGASRAASVPSAGRSNPNSWRQPVAVNRRSSAQRAASS